MSGTILLVTEQHRTIPVVYNLGSHSLIITNDYSAPDAFELAAPIIDEATHEVTPDSPTTLILDNDETYNLYQCLHALFVKPATGEEVGD